jgi:hypothetical protein
MVLKELPPARLETKAILPALDRSLAVAAWPESVFELICPPRRMQPPPYTKNAESKKQVATNCEFLPDSIVILLVPVYRHPKNIMSGRMRPIDGDSTYQTNL